MIDTQAFNHLQQIAKSGSFAKASETLFVTRSALVQQTKAIENRLGFTVFNRSPKGITLTDAGRIFLEEGALIAKSYERLCQKCLSISTQKPAITIGTLASTASSLLPAICESFNKRYPNVDISFKQYLINDYFPAFIAGEFDLTCDNTFDFSYKYHSLPGFCFLKIAPTRYYLCVYKDDPLAGLQKINFKNLRGRKLIMHRRGIAKSDDVLRNYLETNEPEIKIVDTDFYYTGIAIKCRLENALLLACENFGVQSTDYILIPTDDSISVERGFCYFKDCSLQVKNFLQEAKRVSDNLSDGNVDRNKNPE